ncbi:glycosyltransferase family 2 protein [Protaetiibacter larvae]|uniref:Glycosyltransferase n=1 Tax=Protaetiibacter larvae TaxID=2592654 RepID=A0A5C1Y8F1_9MICO|nr:glycosyltransferase [Protaetiibacter larvae]QEO10254.1 glycosyltransferase [Protaetiibacter larvae]
MPSPADLAVVVCTRERPEMLRHALETIVRFTPRQTRLVVVDSASTTAATRIVALEAGASYLRTDIKGLSIARNVGLAASARDFLVYTDDDCVAIDGWIAGILAHFADADVGAVTGEMIDAATATEHIPAQPRRITRTIDGLDAGHGALMAFRREALESIGGFDEVLGAGRLLAGAEDLDIFCRLLDAGWTITYDPGCVVHHAHTRDDDAYEKLYLGYGLGLGGLIGKWLRLRPPLGVRMFGVLAGRNFRRMLRSWRHPRSGPAERAMLRGIFRGIGAATRMQLVAGRFVDATPPAPIVLASVSQEEV